MNISLRRIMYGMLQPDMVFVKLKYEIFELEEIDLYKLSIYKDYINLPYVKRSIIYDEFLDLMHLHKEKIKLHQNEDFESEFRRFIDCNKKYDHSLFNPYINFEMEKLKSIAVEWCSKHKIRYIDDTL